MFPKNDWSYFEYQKSDKIVLEGLITRFPIQENKDHKKMLARLWADLYPARKTQFCCCKLDWRHPWCLRGD